MTARPAAPADPSASWPPHAVAPLRPGARRWSAAWLLDGPAWTWLRLAVDLLMLALAVGAALVGANAAHVPLEYRGVLFAYPPLVIVLLALRGMYRRKLRIFVLEGLPTVVSAISIGAMLLLAAAVITTPSAKPAPLLARAWLFGVLYVGGGRMLLAFCQNEARRRGLLGKPALIVGAGVVGAHVARRLEAHPEYGLLPAGYLDADPPPVSEVQDRRAPVLGGPEDLAEVARRTGAAHVILAFSSTPDRGLVPLVRECDELGMEVWLVPRLFDSLNERVALEHLGGMPLLGLRAVDPKGWQFALKHGFDRLASGLALVALGPLLLVLAIAVRAGSPGSVFFRQRRVGRDGQVFDLLKFRSMRPARPDPSFSPAEGSAPGGIEGEDRRTALGRWLRRTSLDELPQLINVARGEMSLVGPRPERPEFVELFRQDVDRYGDRHRVKSGITGWAQVHGLRGQTSIADRVEWDNYYIENWSLWLDARILVLTLLAVLRGGDDA